MVGVSLVQTLLRTLWLLQPRPPLSPSNPNTRLKKPNKKPEFKDPPLAEIRRCLRSVQRNIADMLLQGSDHPYIDLCEAYALDDLSPEARFAYVSGELLATSADVYSV